MIMLMMLAMLIIKILLLLLLLLLLIIIVIIMIMTMTKQSAQDKGGPSKGGFLNNIVFSYTDLYLCNEINGICI